jgi:asparagine synthase (glutamine-hydrolysing)
MSGIVGVVNLDGAPVSGELLARMTHFLAPRGPDSQRTWLAGNVGFGHALLTIDPGVAQRPQPCSVDGRVWITADARLDARDELIGKLRRSALIDSTACDAELILHAHKIWGESCLDHLFGEFVFAIWDGERRQLLCAHDQLGTRPLYFARKQQQVIVSNTLDCVRLHPAVSSKVNDAAIGDFLLFGLNYNPETTSFSDIRRLPPGHLATWGANNYVQRQYWQMPIDEPLFYRRRQDYIDQFQSLLTTAVKERLPRGKIGISMSGGLDSSLLAAAANGLKRASGTAGDVFGITYVYDRLIPDQERHYSSVVARYLAIPEHFFTADGADEEEMWDQIPEPPSEPTSPWRANISRLAYQRLASLGRVYFYGEGPDNALHYEWRPYLAYLMRRRQWGRLLRDAGQHIWLHRRVPLLPILPRMLREARAKSSSAGTRMPDWLNPDFSRRFSLEERCREILTAAPPCEHPVRRRGYASFKSTLWQRLFEECDSGGGRFPIEFRHPYLNLPLLRFMLALPALPWCRVKYIQRVAGRGMLPAEILRRPKTPLAGFPEAEMAKRRGVPAVLSSAALQRFILADKVRCDINSDYAIRAVGLSYWLHALAVRSKSETEKGRGAGQRQGI